MITRAVLVLVGAAAAAYGVWLLLDRGSDNLVATATWLGAGVLLHDLVLAPLVIAVCALPFAGPWRGPLAAGLLVLGTLTLTAVPVLSGLGGRPDNPTLLDRNYWAGWLVVVALTGAMVVGLRLAGVRKHV